MKKPTRGQPCGYCRYWPRCLSFPARYCEGELYDELEYELSVLDLEYSLDHGVRAAAAGECWRVIFYTIQGLDLVLEDATAVAKKIARWWQGWWSRNREKLAWTVMLAYLLAAWLVAMLL